MKTTLKLLGAASLLALSAGGAWAASPATGTVNITADIEATCTIGGSATATAPDLDFSNTPATPSATISTAPQTATFASVSCNTPTHIDLQSGDGAATGPAAAAGFDEFFDYTAVATFGVATTTLNTATAPAFGAPETAVGTIGTAGPSTGSLTVAVTPVNPNPLVSGSYLDVLTVTLTAN